MPPIYPEHDVSWVFVMQAAQYYMAGRYSMLAMFTPVAGLLWHHALERFLKSEIVKLKPELKATELDKYLRKTYGHKLIKLWEDIKEMHPNCWLDDYDGVVKKIDSFEEIRYPNVHDATTTIQLTVERTDEHIFGPVTGKESSTKQYLMSLEEMDALVFKLCHVFQFAPGWFLGPDEESRQRVQTAYFLDNRWPLFKPTTEIAFAKVSFLPPRPEDFPTK
jgi:hypothetical protein